jgi:hypothetical protein
MTLRSVHYSAALSAAGAMLLLSLNGQAQAPAGGQKPQAASVPTPRTPDGKPDLSGRWGGGGGGGEGGLSVLDPKQGEVVFDNFQDYETALAAGKVAANSKIIGRRVTGYRHGNNVYSERDSGFSQRAVANPPLYKPEFWDRVQYLDVNGNAEDTNFSCMPAGVPRMGPPMKIVQLPNEMIFFYNARNTWRIIPTDGRPHDPVNSEDQTFMGDSIGRWEGDTFVVDVVGFNDISWLGWPGWFHSNEMRVEERFRREGNTLRYEVTVHDPAVLVEPWVMEPRALNLNTSNGIYLEDPACIEQDLQKMLTKERG